ncbi:MAG: S-layer homology domain-containing protein [Clostridia bacterium]|nr:S-layer homology domain-containing protein [Clostridia bacterium]
MKNRAFSVIAALIMLISCMNITTASAEEYITYELVNFRGESLNANISGKNVSQANDFGYDTNTNSLSWTVRSVVDYTVENKADWTEYESVHIRLHSSVDQKINIIFCGSAAEVSSGKYSRKLAEVKGGTWQDIEFPITGIKTGLGASDDKKSIAMIRFDHNGWGNKEYVAGSKIHIDSIFLTKAGFKILNTQPEDKAAGVDASEGFQYTISFNNELDSAADYSEYISVADGNGSAVENYTVSAAEKSLTLTFNEALSYKTEYTVSASADLKDADENILGEEGTFTFTTGGEPLKISDDGVVFSAASPEDMTNIIANGAAEEPENTFIYNSAAKIEYQAGKDKTAVIAYKNGDISGYTHVNYLMYNPKAIDEKINLLMYSRNGEYYYRTLTTDWEGWRVLSLPIPVNEKADPTKMVRFSINFNAWDNKRSKDGYLLLGRMWFSDHEIGALSLTETEYENEESYVSGNLGGDNKFSFTYDRELEGVIGDVEVSRRIGGEYVPYTDFTAEVDGNKMNVVFPSALETGETYKISVLENCVLSKDFGMNDSSAEITFTVEAETPYFRLVSVSPEKGAEVTAADNFSVTLTFNKAPGKQCDPQSYINIYKDDEKQFGLFEAEHDGNSVILHFVSAPEAGKTYYIRISGDYSDSSGNKIIGNTETEFYTYEEASGDTTVIFSAGDADKLKEMAALSGYSAVNTTNTNLNASNLKLSYAAGKDLSLFILKDEVKSTAGMEYANFLIYSPEAINEPMNIIFYTDRSSNKYIQYKTDTNWEGWRLLSVPLSEILYPAKLDSVSINFGGWRTTRTKDGYVLVDEAWLSAAKPQPPVLVSSSVPDGYTGVQAAGASITYEFGETLNADNGVSVTVTNKLSEEIITDYTAEISGSQVTLNFGALDENTEYRVEINGLCSKVGMKQTAAAIHSFTTAGLNIYVSSIDFDNRELTPGGMLTANYEIINSSPKRANLICMLNLYDENNILISKREYGISCEGISKENVDLSIDVSSGAVRAIAYAVNSDGEIISDKFAVLKGGVVSNNTQSIVGGSEKSLTVDRADLNVNNLSAHGTVQGAGNTVILTVAGEGGTVVTVMPLSADSNGKFAYSCRMPSAAPSGKYNVTAAGSGMQAGMSFNYVSNSDRDEFLRLLSIGDVKSVSQWIIKHAEAIGMEACSSEKAEDLAAVLLEGGLYGTYYEAINSIVEISDILKGLNSCTWAGMGAYLEKFHITVLGKDSTDYAYFSSLSEKNQNIILSDVAKSMPVQTIAEFRKAFAAAVEAYKSAAPTVKPGGSGGGGGGGNSSGGGKQHAFTTPVASSAPVDITTAPQKGQNEIFDDLGDYPWAKEGVEFLYSRGIISEAEDKKFRPSDNITREEFVKLIVCAFCDDLSAREHEFSDADKNAWYSVYLWTAYAEGIAEGYEDGRFGIGESITREDMVTMVCRAISKAGILPDPEDKAGALNYTDADSISDYALEYVRIMSLYGAVSGMGDGSFAPKATANRAQAAKVIYQLLELTDKKEVA